LSLIELVVSLALGAMAGGAVLILTAHTSRSFVDMVNYVDLDHANRIALDTMTRELRQVTELTSFSPTALTFSDKDGQPLSYQYSPAARSLVRIKGGQKTEVLKQCDALSFAIFQRTPLSQNYALIPATSPAICKVITVTWSCSRTVFGTKANTEQGQAAKIVIRNKKET
jgi:hypothetical protein